MVALLLRKQNAQSKREGSTAEWKDDDYAVLHDEVVIGRVYRIDGGPQGGHWRWALTHQKFYQARRGGIVLSAVSESLDAAKAEIKGEYEAWLKG